jgi:hypothetical protein
MRSFSPWPLEHLQTNQPAAIGKAQTNGMVSAGSRQQRDSPPAHGLRASGVPGCISMAGRLLLCCALASVQPGASLVRDTSIACPVLPGWPPL